jgi:hypothetical protein
MTCKSCIRSPLKVASVLLMRMQDIGISLLSVSVERLGS